MVRITHRPNMTSADYCGCKGTNQTNKKSLKTDFIFQLQIAEEEIRCIFDDI